MLSFVLATIFLSSRNPQPLGLENVKDERWGEIIQYEEWGLGSGNHITASMRRNLAFSCRKINFEQFEVEFKEVGRKTEILGIGGSPRVTLDANAKAAFLERFNKYVATMPMAYVTDRWGLSTPRGLDSTKFATGFLGFYLPRKLQKGQKTWKVEMQPPVHVGGYYTPKIPIDYKFDGSPVLAKGQPDFDDYSYECEISLDPPFGDERHTTDFRMNGACWVDPKLRQITLSSSSISWAVYDEGNANRSSRGRGLSIRRTLQRGQKWDLS